MFSETGTRFVNQDFLAMTLFQAGIIQVKGTFQNTIVATLNSDRI